MTLEVQVVSPERILWTGDAERVITRTAGGGGEIAFLTGHAPFVGALDVGVTRVLPAGGGEELAVAVHGGFVEVSGDQVSILSDVAELAGDIDVARAQAALERLQATTPTEDEAEEVELALRRAQARLDAAQRHAS
jgi:F-type H+-transporting ATPase subunit epsilon